jgi:phosphate starvation-inducible PhoH-like protein
MKGTSVKQSFVNIRPRKGQEDYHDSLDNNTLTICTGIAGTGKTFLALKKALKELYNKTSKIDRVVVIRPYIQSNTGEKLGALPGDLREKVSPYVESIKDNLREMIKNEGEIARLINEKFEFTVLSMCRGRSFNNAFVIVEEAQNVPLDGAAMKMILTRIGRNCKMVIAGDLDQCDIPTENSALAEAINLLDGMSNVGIIEMNDVATVQRSPLVRDILVRYDQGLEY